MSNVKATKKNLLARSYVDKKTGCWIWTGAITNSGSGWVQGTSVYRHAFELWRGPIPEGAQLDHRRCQNKKCINPDHLEPVTRAENQRRAIANKYGQMSRRPLQIAYWLHTIVGERGMTR